MKVTILGCGASTGVPAIGCDCKVCTSNNPKNNRSRASVLVNINYTTLLIDSSPDFRKQALNNDITHFDAVLYTHDHFDHTNGLDDLRAFNFMQKKQIEVYSDETTITTLKNRFAHAFLPPNPENPWAKPCLKETIITPGKSFVINGTDILPFKQIHGKMHSLGFRIDNFAYSTDISAMNDETKHALQHLDCWIVDCLKYNPAPTHSHLEQTLDWINELKPKRAVLTHMGHDIDYDEIKQQLPEHIVPAYDGMVVDNL